MPFLFFPLFILVCIFFSRTEGKGELAARRQRADSGGTGQNVRRYSL